ncbi:MAG TPA: hypothetical protein VMU66_07120 [Gaiellales bacterium]|nr:hypothetical protein [Gaiellales bacterium]
MSVVAGTGLALGAAVVFAVAALLQVPAARAQPSELAMRPGLLWALMRSRRWIAGSVAAVTGWLLQAAALTLAPLTVVQPALALSLAVILVAAPRGLGEHVRPREWIAVTAAGAGVVAVALAAPQRSSTHASPALLAVVVTVLAAIVAAPFLLHRHNPNGLGLAFCAGTAFALCGIATKLVTDSTGRPVAAVGWLALTGLAAAAGGVTEMSAFRSRATVSVVPLVFAAETVLPVLAAPLIFGERWAGISILDRATLATGLVLILAGAVTIARSPLVVATVTAGAEHPQPGGDGQPPVRTPTPTGQATPVPPRPQ